MNDSTIYPTNSNNSLSFSFQNNSHLRAPKKNRTRFSRINQSEPSSPPRIPLSPVKFNIFTSETIEPTPNQFSPIGSPPRARRKLLSTVAFNKENDLSPIAVPLSQIKPGKRKNQSQNEREGLSNKKERSISRFDLGSLSDDGDESYSSLSDSGKSSSPNSSSPKSPLSVEEELSLFGFPQREKDPSSLACKMSLLEDDSDEGKVEEDDEPFEMRSRFDDSISPRFHARGPLFLPIHNNVFSYHDIHYPLSILPSEGQYNRGYEFVQNVGNDEVENLNSITIKGEVLNIKDLILKHPLEGTSNLELTECIKTFKFFSKSETELELQKIGLQIPKYYLTPMESTAAEIINYWIVEKMAAPVNTDEWKEFNDEGEHKTLKELSPASQMLLYQARKILNYMWENKDNEDNFLNLLDFKPDNLMYNSRGELCYVDGNILWCDLGGAEAPITKYFQKWGQGNPHIIDFLTETYPDIKQSMKAGSYQVQVDLAFLCSSDDNSEKHS